MTIQSNSVVPLKTIYPSFIAQKDEVVEMPQTKSYGKKYETLIALREWIKTKKMEGIAIPEMVGLAKEDIELLLKENDSLFFRYWLELQERFAAAGDKKSFLEEFEVQQMIEEMQKEVVAVVKDRHWDRLWNLPDHCFWMVRSSGKEDGEIAAAGYLLSLEYIPSHHVGEAMGKVLASCIDRQFFAALISRGINPFDQYHLSVFLHELIGESMGGETEAKKIPKSAIVFTNEPIYVQGQNFRITRVSATPGHCAALTDSTKGIASDTVLIVQNGQGQPYVVYDNQPKPERLAPRDGKLDLFENPETLIEQPILDELLMRRLYHLSLEMEDFFGQPTDIELVIKNDVIYIVQARSVNRCASEARYIDLDKLSAQTTEMKVVVPGHYEAFMITNPEEYICINNLLDVPNKDYKLVIIHQKEPANSHPVINLSEKNIPCFFHPEAITFPENGDILAVCPQQGIIAQGKLDSFPMKAGYIEHPAPISFGFHHLPKLSSKEISKVLTIIQQIKAAQTKGLALRTLEQLNVYLASFTKKTIRAKAFAAPARKLVHLIDKTIAQIIQTFESRQRLELLFYIKALKVLLIESDFSLLSLNEVLKQTVSYEKSVPDSSLSELAAIPTLTPQVKEKWIAFLKEIEPLTKKIELQELLNRLGDLKSLWLTFYFDSAHAQTHSPKELLDLLLEELDERSSIFLNTLPRHIVRASTRSLAFFESEEFIRGFQQSKPLARIITLSTLCQAVNLYDQLLKSTKRGTSFQIKIKAFKNTFPPFYSLMKKMARELFPNNSMLSENMTAYLRILDQIYNRLMQTDEQPQLLELSRDFVVSAVILGSRTTVERHIFENMTIEDFFTWVHQNLMRMIAALYQKNLPLIANLNLPEELKTCHHQLLQVRRLHHIGTEQTEEGLTFYYNIPLQNHSSTCQLHYHSGQLHFSVQLMGEGRMRWPATAAFLKLLNELGIRPIDRFIYRDTIVDVTWSISPINEISALIELMEAMHERSFSFVESSPSFSKYFQRHVDGKFWIEKGDLLASLFKEGNLFSKNMIIELIVSSAERVLTQKCAWEIALYCLGNHDIDRALTLFLHLSKDSNEKQSGEILELALSRLETHTAQALEIISLLVRNGHPYNAKEIFYQQPLTMASIKLFEAMAEVNQISLHEFEVVCSQILEFSSVDTQEFKYVVSHFFNQTIENLLHQRIVEITDVLNWVAQIVQDQTILVGSLHSHAFALFSKQSQQDHFPPQYFTLICSFADLCEPLFDLKIHFYIKNLLSQGLAYNEALQVAQAFLQKPNPYRIGSSIEILTILASRGYAIEEAKASLASYCTALSQTDLVIKLMLILATQTGCPLENYEKILSEEHSRQIFTFLQSLLLNESQQMPISTLLEEQQALTAVSIYRDLVVNRSINYRPHHTSLLCQFNSILIQRSLLSLMQEMVRKEMDSCDAADLALHFCTASDGQLQKTAIKIFMILVSQKKKLDHAKRAAASIVNPIALNASSLDRLNRMIQYCGSPETESRMHQILKEDDISEMYLWF